MEATTNPYPAPTAEDEDARVCETCDRLVWEDEGHNYPEAGIFVCDDCDAAERDYWMRQCATAMPTLAQLREDEADTIAWCGHGSDEAIKAGMLVTMAGG